MIEKMVFVMNVCLVLGLVIPILDVAVGFFGSLLNMDFDIGGHHLGDIFSVGDAASADGGNVLPFNMMCLCFSMVVFGAVGRLVVPLMTTVWTTVGCLAGLLALSGAAYIALFRYVIKPLKKSNPKALAHWDLFGARGKLTLRITALQEGTVSLKDSTGAMISYPARATEAVLEAWDGIIPQGAEVLVIDVDERNRTLYVKPVDTLENMRLRYPNKKPG